MPDEPDLTAELDAAEDIVLGRKVASARKQRGWTLREAEKRSGVPNAHISQIETGAIRRPEAATLIRLADAYNLPAAELIAIAGREAVDVRIEWGNRYDPVTGRVAIRGTGSEAEQIARDLAKDYEWAGVPGNLVRRTVTYGPWETVPGA